MTCCRLDADRRPWWGSLVVESAVIEAAEAVADTPADETAAALAGSTADGEGEDEGRPLVRGLVTAGGGGIEAGRAVVADG